MEINNIMFFEAACHVCSCVKLPPQGKFTLGSYYVFEYLIDAEKVIDDSGNGIVVSEKRFKLYFENHGKAVTSYSPMSMDCTIYSIYLMIQDTIPALEEIKAYAKIMNKNYLQAKKALKQRNLLISGNAYDIMEVLKKLNTFQVRYEIEPPYPYKEREMQETGLFKR